jgi:hypothetical protein
LTHIARGRVLLDKIKERISDYLSDDGYREARTAAALGLDPKMVLEMANLKLELVGSRQTYSNHSDYSDYDYLVFVRGKRAHRKIHSILQQTNAALEKGPSMIYHIHQSCFTSWRHGQNNFLIISDAKFYDRFLLASNVCKDLDLAERDDRVSVFKAILYDQRYDRGNDASGADGGY